MRLMLQLNNSCVRLFVSIDEKLQSGLLLLSTSLELLTCMSRAYSLSHAVAYYERFRVLCFAKRQIIPLQTVRYRT